MARSKVRKKTAETVSSRATIESWISNHADWFVWLIVFIGFCLRFQLAGQSYFNSDETQIMFPPFQHGVTRIYRETLTMPYGQFDNVLLCFMTLFGSSEQYFRMLAVIPGALIPFVVYRWTAYLFDRAAGVAAACILAFSPAMVNLSAEIRHYMMHAFWLACAFYFLERAFAEKSRKWMRWFGFSLLIALLTMYMSIWTTAALGVYALLRIFNRELPRPLIIEWAMIQASAVAISAVAYFTHMRRMRGGQAETFAQSAWLRDSYYRPDRESVAQFLVKSSKALFVYVFANPTVGICMLFIFLLGIGLIVWSNARVPGNRGKVAVSLVLPLIVTSAAAVFDLYPYGGSRHDAYLGLFVAVGVGVAISFLAGHSVTIVVVAALLLVPTWQTYGRQNYLEVPPQLKRLDQMTAALDYLATRTPHPGVLVTDQQGSTMIRYYVCHAQQEDIRYLSPRLTTYRCGANQILVFSEWSVDKSYLEQALWQGRKEVPDAFTDPAWIFTMSDTPAIDGDKAAETEARFGRLYLRRISPPG